MTTSTLPYERELGGIRPRTVRIEPDVITVGGDRMRSEDVVAIRYGAMFLAHAAHDLLGATPLGGLFRTGNVYEIGLRDRSGKSLRVTFSDAIFGGSRSDAFEQLLDALWESVTARLVDRLWDAVESDVPYVVGNVTLRSDGAWIKPWLRKPQQVPWDRLAWVLDNGQLRIGVGGKAPMAHLDLQNEWNAIVLYHALRARQPAF